MTDHSVLPPLPVAGAPAGPPLRFRAAPSALFQLDGPDRFAARASVSSPLITNLRPEHLQVFAAFAEPATLARAQEELYDALDPHDVQMLGDELLENGLLMVDALERVFTDGFGRLDPHFPMVADTARVEAYAQAIARHAPGKAVAELGCGSGILTVLAARAGAESVWAVEETEIIHTARRMIAANVDGVPVEVAHGESYEHAPTYEVDLLIHEIFGLDPFDEGILNAIADARERWLAPGGRLLPHAFSVWAIALGPATKREAAVGARIDGLASRWGLDLGPLRHAAKAGFFVHPSPAFVAPSPERALTDAVKAYTVDLYDPQVPERCTVRLPIRRDGPITNVLMWFDIHLDEQTTLSTGPFAPRTHWGWQDHERVDPLATMAGDTFELDLAFSVEDVGESIRIDGARVIRGPVGAR